MQEAARRAVRDWEESWGEARGGGGWWREWGVAKETALASVLQEVGLPQLHSAIRAGRAWK